MQRKINKLVKIKKYIEIPSKPIEKFMLKKDKSKNRLVAFWKKEVLVLKLINNQIE